MFEEELRNAGELATELVLPGCDWVHRRVQRVSFLGPRLMVNRLSVDFTPPNDGIGAYVPISVLPKWPPLYDFDFHAANGKAVPLLTSAQNGIIDEALLRALVQKVSPSSLAQPDFTKALQSLTRGPETHLTEAFETFKRGLQGDFGEPDVERLVDIAAMLTDATFLWYPVPEVERGTRTICKLEYLIPGLEIDSLRRRVLRSLSWSQPAEWIPLWHIGADANFHAEVEAPAVMTIRSVEPSYYWFTEDEPAVEVDAATAEAEKAGLRPDQFVDNEGGLSHIYVAGRRPLGADLVTTLVASRVAILPMFLATVVIAALATAFYAWRGQMVEGNNRDAAVAVLILVPALIGYVVIRPADHPSLRSRILGVQVLSVGSAVIPLLMSILLLRFAGEAGCLKTAWGWSVVASWVLAAFLFVSLLRAGSGLPRRK